MLLPSYTLPLLQGGLFSKCHKSPCPSPYPFPPPPPLDLRVPSAASHSLCSLLFLPLTVFAGFLKYVFPEALVILPSWLIGTAVSFSGARTGWTWNPGWNWSLGFSSQAPGHRHSKQTKICSNELHFEKSVIEDAELDNDKEYFSWYIPLFDSSDINTDQEKLSCRLKLNHWNTKGNRGRV